MTLEQKSFMAGEAFELTRAIGTKGVFLPLNFWYELPAMELQEDCVMWKRKEYCNKERNRQIEEVHACQAKTISPNLGPDLAAMAPTDENYH